MLFFGMALCLPLVMCIRREKSDKKRVNSVLMLIPSLCDVLATICDATGLIYVSIIKYI